MIRSIKRWFRVKWLRWNNICQLCGVDPVNNIKEITTDPYYSDDYCRFCMKRWYFASSYGMSKSKMVELINKTK